MPFHRSGRQTDLGRPRPRRGRRPVAGGTVASPNLETLDVREPRPPTLSLLGIGPVDDSPPLDERAARFRPLFNSLVERYKIYLVRVGPSLTHVADAGSLLGAGVPEGNRNEGLQAVGSWIADDNDSSRPIEAAAMEHRRPTGRLPSVGAAPLGRDLVLDAGDGPAHSGAGGRTERAVGDRARYRGSSCRWLRLLGTERRHAPCRPGLVERE